MKKSLCILLALSMLFLVCGCKSNEKQPIGSEDEIGAYNPDANFGQTDGDNSSKESGKGSSNVNSSNVTSNVNSNSNGGNNNSTGGNSGGNSGGNNFVDIGNIGGDSGNGDSTGGTVKYKGGKVTIVGTIGTIDKFDSSALIYKSGEEINFTLRAKTEKNIVDGLQIKYTAVYEDGTPTQTGIGDCNKDGKVQIKLTPKGPGFIRITATACVGGKEVSDVSTFVGGVGVDVDKITTTDAAPADFESYWKNKVSTLPAPQTISKDLITSGSGYEVYNVRIAGPSDNAPYESLNDGVDHNFASFVIAIPTSSGSYPVEIKYVAHGVNNITDHSGSSSKIKITVQAHSIDAYESSSVYWSNYSKGLSGYQNKSYEGQSYFVNMILRDYQVIRWLQQNDLVTAAKSNGSISLTGGSQGGFRSTAVAGLCGMTGIGIKSASISIVWNCNLSGHNTMNIGSWHTPYNQYTKYIDTVYFAPYVKCKVTIDPVGLGDDIAPPSANMALYNALSSATITFKQNFGHGSGGTSQTKYSLSK